MDTYTKGRYCEQYNTCAHVSSLPYSSRRLRVGFHQALIKNQLFASRQLLGVSMLPFLPAH